MPRDRTTLRLVEGGSGREALGPRAGTPRHQLHACSADGSVTVALGRDDIERSTDITAETLAASGITATDRVVVALNSDGAGVGTRWAQAAASVAEAACGVGPRRAAHAINAMTALRATVLVTTPTVALRLQTSGADNASVRMVVLTGELVDDRVREWIGQAFEAAVADAWCDPVFGAAVAFRPPMHRSYFAARPGVLALDSVSARSGQWPAAPLAEWVLTPAWLKQDRAPVRTGTVSVLPAGDASRLPPPRWTIGDELLVRGRWVSIATVRRVARAVGAGWQLVVVRGEGGDRVCLHLSPIPDADLDAVQRELAAVLPVHVHVVTDSEVSSSEARVLDRRGQHLGSRA